MQVHHIVERSHGGSDDVENLIPTCMTCHSDVHTQTELTRRFTESELKLHRHAVYALVREGKLPFQECVGATQVAFANAVESNSTLAKISGLLPKTVELLLTAVKAPYGEWGEGTPLIASYDDATFFFRIGDQNFGHGDVRKAARYRRAFALLVNRDVFELAGGVL